MRAALRTALAVVLALASAWLLLPTVHADPKKLSTRLTASASVQGRTVRLAGSLVDQRQRPVGGASLDLVVDESLTWSVTTASNGGWSSSVAIPSSYGAGTFSVRIGYAGSSRFAPSAALVSFQVTNAAPATAAKPPQQVVPSSAPASRPAASSAPLVTQLTAVGPSAPAAPGTLSMVTGVLTGPGGTFVGGAPITATAPDGSTSQCSTDTQGRYSCPVQIPATAAPGTVTVRVTFAAAPGFAGSTATATIPVRALRTAAPSSAATSQEAPAVEAPVISSASSSPAITASAPTAKAPAKWPPWDLGPYSVPVVVLAGVLLLVGGAALGLAGVKRERRRPARSADHFIDDPE